MNQHSSFIITQNALVKNRPSRERTSFNLTGSEDSRGKLTCLSDWLFHRHSGFQTNLTWKINSSAGEEIDKVLNIWILLIHKEYISSYTEWQGVKRAIYNQKVWFYTYVLATTSNLPEFRLRRRLDDVLTTLRMPRRFARENFTSGRRLRPVSSSMLMVPNVRRRQPSLLTFWPFFFAPFFRSLL